MLARKQVVLRTRSSELPATCRIVRMFSSVWPGSRLQASWVFTQGKAFGSRLTFGPVVPVDPHLQRVGEIAADLDKAQPERWVEDGRGRTRARCLSALFQRPPPE